MIKSANIKIEYDALENFKRNYIKQRGKQFIRRGGSYRFGHDRKYNNLDTDIILDLEKAGHKTGVEILDDNVVSIIKKDNEGENGEKIFHTTTIGDKVYEYKDEYINVFDRIKDEDLRSIYLEMQNFIRTMFSERMNVLEFMDKLELIKRGYRKPYEHYDFKLKIDNSEKRYIDDTVDFEISCRLYIDKIVFYSICCNLTMQDLCTIKISES